MKEILNAFEWRHLTFIFCLAFIYIFRDSGKDLIGRLTHIKIGKDGLTANSPQEVQQKKIEENIDTVQKLLDVVGNSIVINELENNIKTGLEEKRLPTDSDTAKILIKHLAGANLLLTFEQIHSNIFGSQIFLLKKLNEAVESGINIGEINQYIEEIKKEYPDQLGDWTSESYLNFLFSHLLITSKSEFIHITNLGIEYLTWIVRNGRKENKLL